MRRGPRFCIDALLSHRPRFASLRWRSAGLLFLLIASACSVAPSDESVGGAADSVARADESVGGAADSVARADESVGGAADSVAPSERSVHDSPSPAAAADQPGRGGNDRPEADTTVTGSTATGPQSAASQLPAPTPTPDFGSPLTPAPVGLDALSTALDASGALPIGLTIETIGVIEAPVIPVGINDVDASMEIPPAEEVGWYRFGASPGAAGSAVLAAHIAYDGRDGVFRRLAEVQTGSVVIVAFDDGSSQRWLVEEVMDYDKAELPDELFAADGDPRLALITCGGAFNPSLRSYDSNTVAVARLL